MDTISAAPRTFVLVHGAFHGGWCWDDVAQRLRAAGHRVLAPTLAGLAERAHLATQEVNLTTHILEIADLLKREDLSDVILCGHSYGGLVVTGAAERVPPGTIGTLVYLDAIVPRNGLALIDYFPPVPEGASGARVLPDLSTGLIPAPEASDFGLPPALQETVAKRLTPQPLGTFTEPLHLTGMADESTRRVFVLCTGPSSLPSLAAVANELRGTPGWRVEVLGCAHDAMIEDPDAVATILLRT
jgi:pimeloyl-ACP methyl ester carboxylesterase